MLMLNGMDIQKITLFDSNNIFAKQKGPIFGAFQ